MASVEHYARTLLAEMETLAVSGQEAGKKAKVAAIAAPASPTPKTPSKGDGKGGNKGECSAKGDRTQTLRPKPRVVAGPQTQHRGALQTPAAL